MIFTAYVIESRILAASFAGHSQRRLLLILLTILIILLIML